MVPSHRIGDAVGPLWPVSAARGVNSREASIGINVNATISDTTSENATVSAWSRKSCAATPSTKTIGTKTQIVVIVEDVTTSGASIRESVPIIRAAAADVGGVDLRAVMISVNRMEKGRGEASALDEIADEFGMPIHAIVTLDEVIEHLRGRPIDGRVVLDEAMLERIEAYRERYGV